MDSNRALNADHAGVSSIIERAYNGTLSAFVVMTYISELRRTEYKQTRINGIGMIYRIALMKLHSMAYVFPMPE